MILRFLFLDLTCAILYESNIFTCVGYIKYFVESKLFVEVYKHFIYSSAVDLRILVLIIVTVFANVRESPRQYLLASNFKV